MRFTIDSGKLLYALGVLFAAAALLYFVRDVVFNLSITVKAVLLLLAFVAFLVAGLTLQRDVLDAVAFALAGVTYVVFVGYVVIRYAPGETGTFVILALSAAVFVGLGFLLRQGDVAVPGRQALAAVGALLLVGIVLVGVDAGGGVTYAFEPAESVTVEPAETDEPVPYSPAQEPIGSVDADNPSTFTRALSLPELTGCLAGVDGGPREDVWVSYESTGYDSPNNIAGGTNREFAVNADIPVPANRTEPTTYAVERTTTCDAERDTPTLLVIVEED